MIVAPYVICGVLLFVIAIISRKNIRLNTKIMSMSESNFQLENRLISMQEELSEFQDEYIYPDIDDITVESQDDNGCNVIEQHTNKGSSSRFSDCKDYIRYQRRLNYLSRDEIDFSNTIRQVIPDKYIMFPQINLAAIVQRYNTSNKKQTKFRGELFRNIDFGLFDRSTYKLELLIELNDPTHDQFDRKIRDEKVNSICLSAGIKLITFSYKENLDAASVQEKISIAINCNSAYLLQNIIKKNSESALSR